MEFCGAGSLQDIYQGEWQGKEIRQPLALQSTCPVPLPLRLWGLSFWSVSHRTLPLDQAWSGRCWGDCGTQAGPEPYILQDLRVQL